jgi:hypothetical protein
MRSIVDRAPSVAFAAFAFAVARVRAFSTSRARASFGRVASRGARSTRVAIGRRREDLAVASRRGETLKHGPIGTRPSVRVEKLNLRVRRRRAANARRLATRDDGRWTRRRARDARDADAGADGRDADADDAAGRRSRGTTRARRANEGKS